MAGPRASQEMAPTGALVNARFLMAQGLTSSLGRECKQTAGRTRPRRSGPQKTLEATPSPPEPGSVITPLAADGGPGARRSLCEDPGQRPFRWRSPETPSSGARGLAATALHKAAGPWWGRRDTWTWSGMPGSLAEWGPEHHLQKERELGQKRLRPLWAGHGSLAAERHTPQTQSPEHGKPPPRGLEGRGPEWVLPLWRGWSARRAPSVAPGLPVTCLFQPPDAPDPGSWLLPPPGGLQWPVLLPLLLC